jgi:hypothetical protein
MSNTKIKAQFNSWATQVPQGLEPEEQTLLTHLPLKMAGVSCREVWAHTSVQYFHPNGAEYALQSQQCIPVWARASATRWEHCAPVQVTTQTAFITAGRYMVQGGGSKLSSHPKIEAYEDDSHGLSGKSLELRFPSGTRRLRLAETTPVVAAHDQKNFDMRVSTAKSFHNKFRECVLSEGNCPLHLIAFGDVAAPGCSPSSAFNVLTGDVEAVTVLPLPMILSDIEQRVILEEESAEWPQAVLEYVNAYQIGLVGVMLSSPDPMSQELKGGDGPPILYRSAMTSGDIGTPGLDPDLYERFAPFAHGKYEE